MCMSLYNFSMPSIALVQGRPKLPGEVRHSTTLEIHPNNSENIATYEIPDCAKSSGKEKKTRAGWAIERNWSLNGALKSMQ